ncbi:TSUP family transporter [Vibrio sp. SS-MA-C1-2]|uniref:TSUP family transporter n=1 Tax=Vibrio sp. SS-MA-C1-2 TaxID=2908646 RepID=UPI001F34E262|nr:TSUP family transporter [Vibrio sp. SS-MA-C1-2]UJF17532.1 TSUP family transporter [Vibrio sp. SS-MA-C1-2]
MELELSTLILLFLTGLFAGGIDAIAGGGGLVSVPILLSVGISPAQTLATNKLQSSIGTSIACYSYWRHGLIKFSALKVPIIFTIIGSALGSIAIQFLEGQTLEALIPILLICFAVYFYFSPRISDEDSHQRLTMSTFGFLIGTTVGFYDGFFGPGTGSFFAIAFVSLLGFNMTKATANTKVLNLCSNLGALSMFLIGGHVLWAIGLTMAAGQIIGAKIGSGLAVKNGSKLIKPVLVTVSIAMSTKLIWEQYHSEIMQFIHNIIA